MRGSRKDREVGMGKAITERDEVAIVVFNCLNLDAKKGHYMVVNIEVGI